MLHSDFNRSPNAGTNVMRAYLSGEPTPPMLRIERILQERGWQIARARADEAVSGRYELVLVEECASDRLTSSLIADLRQRIDHELVVVLGRTSVIDRSRCLSLGADDSIACDASGALVMCRLMALLRLRMHRFRDRYQIGDLLVDLMRRSVRRHGHDILLSQREFQLLVLLAQDAGTVLPRSAIIEGLWAGDLSVGANAVDALASRLRRRIDGPFDKKMLRTIRGVGYCLAGGEELRLAS
jgi:two-component system copper resistance phosphate regulon response regulator CusR